MNDMTTVKQIRDLLWKSVKCINLTHDIDLQSAQLFDKFRTKTSILLDECSIKIFYITSFIIICQYRQTGLVVIDSILENLRSNGGLNISRIQIINTTYVILNEVNFNITFDYADAAQSNLNSNTIVTNLADRTNSTVYKGFCSIRNTPIVIKTYKNLDKELTQKSLIREITTLIMLGHNSLIINLLEYYYDPIRSQFLIVTEFISETLDNYISRHRTNLSHKICLNHIVNLIQGVNYIHQKGILHGDLTKYNIFVSAGTQIKIGDFDKSREVPFVGLTLLSEDVLACGYLIYYILLGNDLFSNKADIAFIGRKLPILEKAFAPEALLIYPMLDFDKVKRITITKSLEKWSQHLEKLDC